VLASTASADVQDVNTHRGRREGTKRCGKIPILVNRNANKTRGRRDAAKRHAMEWRIPGWCEGDGGAGAAACRARR
jgi:hypothetical protein